MKSEITTRHRAREVQFRARLIKIAKWCGLGLTYLCSVRDWLDLGISDWHGVLEDMSGIGKFMRQNGTPRFGFWTRGRFRRVGEHLPPCLPFGIGVARRGLAEAQKRLRCFQENDFVGLEYV